jgi:flagellar motor switch protein FliM
MTQVAANDADGHFVTNPPSAPSAPRAGRISRRGDKAGPSPYDFRRPSKLSREHVRSLQIAFETYARGCATLLTTRLRADSKVTLAAIEQQNYEEYVTSLANPTVISQVTLDPLPGTVLLEMSSRVTMASIDHLLGGPGGAQPERPLTEVEIPLLRGLLERMLGELRYGFEKLVHIQPKLGPLEYNAQFLRAHQPGDAIIVASFDMKIGSEECVSTICLPFNTILPVLEKLDKVEMTAAERRTKESAFQSMSAGLSAAPIDVSVRFQPIRMRTDDIVGLTPGDVVPLAHSTSLPLEIAVNGNVFAHAVPGNQGARLACLVVPAPIEENRT